MKPDLILRSKRTQKEADGIRSSGVVLEGGRAVVGGKGKRKLLYLPSVRTIHFTVE